MEQFENAVLNQYERYSIETIDRGKIKNAPYNPRKITESAKKRLKKNISEKGLLTPIVWNEATGNIVSGHQRISALDSLSGGKDYLITVAKVNLSDKEEKEQNIFMNNPMAQGDFDLVMMSEMRKDIDFGEAGFDPSEVKRIFNDEIDELNEKELMEISEKIREQQKNREQVKKKTKESGKDYYTVLVFENDDENMKFQEYFDLIPGMFQDGRTMFEKIKERQYKGNE